MAELGRAVAKLSNKQLGEGDQPHEELSPELIYSFGPYKTFNYPQPSYRYAFPSGDLDQFCQTYGLGPRIKKGLDGMSFKLGDRLDDVMNYTRWSRFFEPFEWKKVLDAIEDYWVVWMEREEVTLEAQRDALLHDD